MKAPRDLIFGMYTHETARHDIRYLHLYFLVIKGHKRLQKVTVIRGVKGHFWEFFLNIFLNNFFLNQFYRGFVAINGAF